MYVAYIHTALEGAKYHEDQAFLLAHPQKLQYKKVVFHMRAYFWELWSVWDYILQHANKQTLNEDAGDVRYKNGKTFIEQIEGKFPKYKFLSQLKEINKHERLQRIKTLRNYAHKWQIEPNQVDINGEVVNVIILDNLNAQEKELSQQINIDRNDLSFMVDFVNKLTDNGFFNPEAIKENQGANTSLRAEQ